MRLSVLGTQAWSAYRDEAEEFRTSANAARHLPLSPESREEEGPGWRDERGQTTKVASGCAAKEIAETYGRDAINGSILYSVRISLPPANGRSCGPERPARAQLLGC